MGSTGERSGRRGAAGSSPSGRFRRPGPSRSPSHRTASRAVVPVEARDPGGVATAFRRYLSGDLDVLDAIEVDGPGTPFQRRVWAELRKIPVGTAISYGELARRMGDPNASRAVAGANGANPIAVVVPCHRVVAASGDLWGYGGGLHRKRWLLAHEGVPLTPDGRRVVWAG